VLGHYADGSQRHWYPVDAVVSPKWYRQPLDKLLEPLAAANPYRLFAPGTRRPEIRMCCNDVMSPHDHAADIADIEAIKQVKYRYLRALDTKHWDDYADTLAEDIKADYGPSIGKELHFTNRADLVDYMRTSLGPNVITEHRVTHPEIIVTGDTASGSWYLQDRVIVAEFNFMLIGAAFYRDEYRRTEDGWKISVTGYDRTYDATMSLADLDFKIKPGRAIAI
jgi:SnoaL-like domain